MIRSFERAVDTALDRTIVLGYSRIGYRVRRRLWDAQQLPRLDGRTFAVSGATSGLGQATAQALAALGAGVILLVRDPARGERTRESVTANTGNDNVRVIVCDLASLASIRAAAEELRACAPRLAGLVNNASVLPAARLESADGIELTFATNVLGTFLLTNLLVPVLQAGAPSRIVTVSSGGIYGQRLRTEDLQNQDGEFSGTVAYARSKRAQVILTEQWAQRYRSRGIVAHSMHPGWADTPGVRSSLPRFHRLTRPILRTAEEGADTVVWLAASEEAGHSTGEFWHDRRRRATHLLPGTRETETQRDLLWQRCVELSGSGPDPSAVSVRAATGGNG